MIICRAGSKIQKHTLKEKPVCFFSTNTLILDPCDADGSCFSLKAALTVILLELLSKDHRLFCYIEIINSSNQLSRVNKRSFSVFYYANGSLRTVVTDLGWKRSNQEVIIIDWCIRLYFNQDLVINPVVTKILQAENEPDAHFPIL